jgi:2-iminobutanoate/2-iminopropanoate deaminase
MRLGYTFLAGLAGGLLGAYLFTYFGASAATAQAVKSFHELQILSTPAQDALKLPFAEGVRVGDVIVLSGQIGAKPGSLELVPGGIQAETRQTLENIKTSLERYGSSMQRVVKCTVFIADMADWPAMNEVYVEMFKGHRPARSAVGASGLALDGNVEIECFALAGK